MLLGIAHAEHHETTRRIVLFPCRSAKTLSAGRNGGMSPDCSRVPVDASAKTKLIGRPPKKRKPWNKAENDHVRLSCEARMMIALIAVKSCRTPDAAGSIAAPVSGARHRQRAYTVGEPLRRDIADWGMSWTRPRTASNVDETDCGARRSLQSVQEGRSIGDIMAVRSSAPASMSYSRRPYRQRVALLLRTTRAKAGRRLR